MRRILTTASLLAIGLLLMAGTGQAAPRLVIDQPEFNFGFVPQNAKISHVFVLTSAGDDSLKIVKVTPGCGCTQTPLEKSELAPGESTNLEVIFSTKGYKSTVTKSPKIQTNDGQPERTVRIRSTVVPRPDSTYPVLIKPYKLDMSQFGTKVRDEMSFTIENVSDMDLAIRLIDWPAGFVEVELPHKVGAGKSVKGTVRLDEKVLESGFDKSFTFELGDEAGSRFTVPVTRQVRTYSTRK